MFGISFIIFAITKIKRKVTIYIEDDKRLIFGNVQQHIALNNIKTVCSKKRYRYKRLGWLKHDVIQITLKSGQIKNYVDIANPQSVVNAIEESIG